MGDVRVRRARPGDAEASIPLIYSAGPEAFTELFSHGHVDARDYLHRAFVKARGLFGCNNHFVADLEGEVVGTMSIYSGVEYNVLSLPVIWQTFTDYRPWLWPKVISGLLKTKSWTPPPNRKTDYVANLGVSPSVRGKGVGTAMLTFGREFARERGKRVYALDVADTNPRAQALYERFGLKITERRSSFAPGRVPNSFRMEMSV